MFLARDMLGQPIHLLARHMLATFVSHAYVSQLIHLLARLALINVTVLARIVSTHCCGNHDGFQWILGLHRKTISLCGVDYENNI